MPTKGKERREENSTGRYSRGFKNKNGNILGIKPLWNRSHILMTVYSL